MIRFLLDHWWAKFVSSFLAGVLICFFFSVPFSRVHYRFVEVLPGALISLAGFILTAAAIVISLRDKGLLKTLADDTPKAWNDLMDQFYGASRFSIAYCFYLFCFDFIPLPDGDRLVSRAAYGLSFSLFVLVVLQLLMAIKSLESASYISSGKASTNGEDRKVAQGKYKLPPDTPTRMYEESPPKKN